jgi:hypothetical protein
MNSNFLARTFEWLGEALEKFNPSAYRFLAAVLPYLTPIPVAWLTAHSATEILKFTPTVSFIFVFALEGIGLWFTSLLVDSVVDWIGSKNWKTFSMIIMFGITVAAYVYILVNLNVTLENAIGTNTNPALSKVITLLCFLPLITGVGNGYYKLKIEGKQKANERTQYERSRDEKVRSETRSDRMERYKLKLQYGQTNEQTNVRNERTKSTNERPTNERQKRTNGGELRTFVIRILDEYERTNHAVAGVSDVAKIIAIQTNKQNGKGDNNFEGYERYKGYVSQVRSDWKSEHPQYQ